MIHRLGRLVAVATFVGLVGCGESEPEEGPQDPGGPKVLSVELAPASVSLGVGERQQLEVKVRGEGAFDPTVAWETSDAEIVTVVEGLVTAVAAGEATITATSVADATKAATATIEVAPTVTPPPGGLRVELHGLPAGLEAGVTVTGPQGYDAVIDESRLLDDLAPGVYQLEAQPLVADLVAYTPNPKTAEIEVRSGALEAVAFTYAAQKIVPIELELKDEPTLPLFGTVTLEVAVRRSHGYEGPVHLWVEGLPAGLEAEPVELAGAQEAATILLSSDGTIRRLGSLEVEIVAEAAGETLRQPMTLHVEALVTELTDDGLGSLRFYLGIAPEIELDEGETLVIRFDPSIDAPVAIPIASTLGAQTDLKIVGPTGEGVVPHVTLDGQGLTTVLAVARGARVEVESLAFRNGKGELGGAIESLGDLVVLDSDFEENEAYLGGAIYSEGALEIHRSTFVKNEADHGGAIRCDGCRIEIHTTIFNENTSMWDGGAILLSHGEAHIEDSLFIHNLSQVGPGGAIGATGDAPPERDGPTLTLLDNTFLGNTAVTGGAILLDGDAKTRIVGGSFSNNLAEGRATISGIGGAINIQARSHVEVNGVLFQRNEADEGGALLLKSASLLVTASTFDDNLAWGGGGAIQVTAPAQGMAEAHVVNSTFARNGATGRGGAIYVHAEGELHLLQSTVSANAADLVGDGICNEGSLTVENSIVAGNGSSQVPGDDVYTFPDASTVSGGHNLIGRVAGAGDFLAPADLLGEAPGLEELADNGGPTPTFALRADSPAVDAIPLAACVGVDGEPLTVDQRGEPRPVGDGCDIGAYERQ